jgi:hypothetical protein
VVLKIWILSPDNRNSKKKHEPFKDALLQGDCFEHTLSRFLDGFGFLNPRLAQEDIFVSIQNQLLPFLET